jgi:hypothetical protein
MAFAQMREARSLLIRRLMQAVAKPSPPPIPVIARHRPGASTELNITPVRPTVTVWIGNNAYQAVRV